MSDDEADPELLELLRQRLGITKAPPGEISSDTGVLKDAEFIYNNAIDVSVDMYGSKAAAESIYTAMKQRGYSTQTWSEHEFHPTKAEGFSEIEIVNFVFTIDLLNFSFWSELSESERFQVEYKGKRCTGYKSLLACLQRAIDENIPVTTPRFWNHPECTDELLRHVFRSATVEDMPLLSQRIAILREAGQVLQESFADPEDQIDTTQPGDLETPQVEESYKEGNHMPAEPLTLDDAATTDSEAISAMDSSNATDNPESNLAGLEETQPSAHAADETIEPGDVAPEQTTIVNLTQLLEASTSPDKSVVRLVEKADQSAGKLVNLLVKYFPSFRDEARFDGRKVRFYKRAQIFVADLWAALNGTSYGAFHDVGHLTMFADYRVPQMLRSLGVLVYSPPLDYAIRDKKRLESGHSWEVQLRGCSIWAVELIRREISRQHADATEVNAVLIDFFLYDLSKEREASGE